MSEKGQLAHVFTPITRRSVIVDTLEVHEAEGIQVRRLPCTISLPSFSQKARCVSKHNSTKVDIS